MYSGQKRISHENKTYQGEVSIIIRDNIFRYDKTSALVEIQKLIDDKIIFHIGYPEDN